MSYIPSTNIVFLDDEYYFDKCMVSTHYKTLNSLYTDGEHVDYYIGDVNYKQRSWFEQLSPSQQRQYLLALFNGEMPNNG